MSILADESCDVANQKKLVVYARALDTETFESSTILLKNVKVSDGSGATISRAILECLDEPNIPMSKVYGFGSDGAKVMTGVKEGVTGHLPRENPLHCSSVSTCQLTSCSRNPLLERLPRDINTPILFLQVFSQQV